MIWISNFDSFWEPPRVTRDAIQSNSFQIIVGDHDSKSNHMEGETNHSIKQVNIHPKWNPDRRAYDYAILELNDKINSTNNHKAICLPNKGYTVLEGQNVRNFPYPVRIRWTAKFGTFLFI